ncbi:MAG: DNA mismatch repair protein MutS, partial [Nitrospirae bacterium]
ILEDAPITIKDGGIIKDGFDKDIDELRTIKKEGKKFIASIEAKERSRTGINSLKIGYNKVFGYYIEVSKANLKQVPPDYIRKQTLVGGERFITEELKTYEDKVIGAEERLKNLEYEVFVRVRDEVAKYSDELYRAASSIAELDVLCSLAVVAKKYNYIKPSVDDSEIIDISEGRHPVVEKTQSERFVPNDIFLDTRDKYIAIITGPNMAGKSTFMRQIALIVLMAQMGSFVPAKEARIGLVDRIFTRIGASDQLSKGQSTFMVEMMETATIVNNATQKSLIILDEVGRGTSTFDGISIAWAVIEYIKKHIRARTLFATHYHELTDLALIHDGIKNLNVLIREWGEEIIFLRKVVEGPADKSYGIHVAKLAGIPEEIIERAKEILLNLENVELNCSGIPRLSGKMRSRQLRKRLQLSLFTQPEEIIKEEILNLDISKLTPEKGLEKLKEIKKKL